MYICTCVLGVSGHVHIYMCVRRERSCTCVLGVRGHIHMYMCVRSEWLCTYVHVC